MRFITSPSRLSTDMRFITSPSRLSADMRFIILLLVCFVVSPSYCVIVDTQTGQVRGHTVDVNNGRENTTVDVFYGIPIGKETSGSRRFVKPEPVDPWSGIFEADTYGDACVQAPDLLLLTDPDWTRISEDCLHINIYSPDAAGGPYPVMVYMYGGGYLLGASFQYVGHFLASRGVVLAIPNYRIGPFGFATTGNDACPGNAGLWDQKLGLEFVQNNIANFGGDPGRVTVFGESAGGTSTSMLVLSPETKDLFHQAIMQSGAEINPWGVNLPESNPENYIYQVAEDLDCVGGDDYQMIDCLRNLPWEDIQNNASFSCTPGYFCIAMVPVVDGPGGFLPETPTELRKAGDVMTGPIISGICKDDGSLFLPVIVPEAIFGCCNRTYFLDVLRNRVLAIFEARLTNTSVEDTWHALDYNYAPWPYVNDNHLNRDALIRLVTDTMFGYPWDTQLKDHWDVASTYGYIFNYKSRNSSASWLGVTHGEDVPYVFGQPLLQFNEAVCNDANKTASYGYNDDDVQFSIFMQELFVNFAKYGNPTPDPVDNHLGGSTSWSTFTWDDMNVIEFQESSIDIIQEYRQKEYAFWSEYIPYVAFKDSPITRQENHFDDIYPHDELELTDLIQKMVPLILHEALADYEDFLDDFDL